MQITLPTSTPTRTDNIRYGCGGGVYKIVSTPAQNDNHHFAFIATEPPGGGPPLHIHANEDEFFLVVEGEVTFAIDGKVIRRRAGSSAFVPRGVPHCFKNCSDEQAKLLIMFTPGDIEGFFEYGAKLQDGSPPSEELMMERLIALAPKFGLKVVGPSPL
jgi:quercetin dioxygenase-like cupin family protein